MASWNPPSTAELGVGKPLTQAKIRAIRDLPAALAERATGSPWVNEVGARVVYPLNFFGELPVFEDTWVVPACVYHAIVTLVGGGGAGSQASPTSGTTAAGGGGGSGAVLIVKIDVTPGQVWGLKVGAGGEPDDNIDPSVDTSLDSFVAGDGARTYFGPYVAAGGKRGQRVAGHVNGGAGGGTIEGQAPTLPGQKGEDGYEAPSVFYQSGKGGGTMFGPGGPGRASDGNGYGQGGYRSAGGGLLVRSSVPGVGGGGAWSSSSTYFGAAGNDGAVIIRY